MRYMNAAKVLAFGSAILVAGACKTLDAPDQNANTLQGLISEPTRAGVISATQGLLSGMRAAGPCTASCAYLGREGFNLDPSNPQNVSTLYITGSDFASWTTTYSNNKQADLILTALGTVAGFTAAQKEGIAGIAQTVKAVDLMYTIQTTDQTGAALEVPANPTDPVPPLASRAQVYARIFSLLDSANAHLAAAGTSFPIVFPAGFAGFTTPANFAKFNRAIKARVDVSFGDYTAALTDLAASFLNAAPTSLAQLNTGVYHTYSTNAGDATNGVYDATDRQRFAHTSYATEAQLQAGATPGDTTKRDARFLRKFGAVRNASGNAIVGGLDRYGFHINWAFRVYNSLADAIPVIRNEELILLRAEARLACTGVAPAPGCTTNAADRAAALADINTVRTVSGGLATLPDELTINVAHPNTGDPLLDELLYNKRYSMVWEGGYRLFDGRKYGILAQLPHDQTGHVVFPYSRLPSSECAQRNIPEDTGVCKPPTGL
ncbi:MAG: hypothetical protein HY700_12345 [Gemmatimonadetes bacterium]|nr:hypothetical protein [Gemmatimonadota bacterium]